MSGERKKIRGVVLTEDLRTECFIRRLLKSLGLDPRGFRFLTAPRGKGAAEQWVLRQYPSEVKMLRRKNFQRLALLAIRDGDGAGVDARKRELDNALVTAGLAKRASDERIGTPVPTWEIENWLLDLLAHPDVDETSGWKQVFEQSFGHEEAAAIARAAKAWLEAEVRLPSLGDGRAELARLDQ